MQDPHDMLFRHVFSDPQQAGPLLRHALPPEVAAGIDWRTLAAAPDAIVQGGVLPASPRTSLLFTAQRNGGGAAIYLLLERRCGPDPGAALEVLQVVARVTQRHCELHPHDRQLPLVLPVVVQH